MPASAGPVPCWCRAGMTNYDTASSGGRGRRRGRKILAILLIPFLIPLAFGGCGKKGSPVALESTKPAPVSDLREWAREGGVFLTWSSPTKNVDGSRLEDLLGFKVFRQARPLTPSSCPDCPLKFEPVAEIDVEYPRGAQVMEGRVLWQDITVKPQYEYTYLVRAYNSYKTPSPESNQVSLFWDEPPAAPTKVSVQSEDKALEMSWEFSPLLLNGKEMVDLSGFNIYRRSEGERFGLLPINSEPVSGNRYRDAALENGKRYYYEVRAVRHFRGTLIEGLSSTVASSIPEKRTPPSPPTGLVAAIQKDGVALRWDPNPEPDIAGYNLYRREKGESVFIKINPQLITENYFLDKEADPHKFYLYGLKAVDTSPARNESEFSKEVEVFPEPSSPKY